MKRKDWATLLSLMAAQTTLILGIGAFGFLRLEARMDRMDARMDRIEARLDRIEERLDDLDRRVARIEGFLGLAEGEGVEPASERPANSGGAGSPPDP